MTNASTQSEQEDYSVQHHEAVRLAMANIGAKLLRTEEIGSHKYRNEAVLEWWVLKKGVVLVQWYKRGGFEIFIPASISGRVDDTLKALHAFATA